MSSNKCLLIFACIICLWYLLEALLDNFYPLVSISYQVGITFWGGLVLSFFSDLLSKQSLKSEVLFRLQPHICYSAYFWPLNSESALVQVIVICELFSFPSNFAKCLLVFVCIIYLWYLLLGASIYHNFSLVTVDFFFHHHCGCFTFLGELL
jgi:hypothetical protein